MLDYSLLDSSYDRVRAHRERKLAADATAGAAEATYVPWDPDKTGWAPALYLDASSYSGQLLRLIDTPPVTLAELRSQCWDALLQQGAMAASPSGEFAYAHVVVPARMPLRLLSSRGTGVAMFNGDVLAPTLYQRRYWRFTGPWMSLTPSELITLRPGTRRAKGDVVITGLGLGHQLIEVSQRKKVKRLRVVDISQELVDWLMPAILPHLGCEVEVIVGDVRDVLPELTADIVLMDHFPAAGGNNQEMKYLMRRCPNIGKSWAWAGWDVR